MHYLRTILIVLLAISIPLPATAAAFGAPPCMKMEMAADSAPGVQETAATVEAADVQDTNECGCGQCDDCVACDAPCATGGSATFNSAAPILSLPSVQGPRSTKLNARALPPHPEDLIRPPSLIQS